MFLWVAITLLAAALQTVRNAAQRGLTGALSPLGATYTRFLFGLPFALVYTTIVFSLTNATPATPPLGFWLWALVGAIGQMFATAMLIQLFQLRNFAAGVAFSKSDILGTALIGYLVLGDVINLLGAIAMLVATGGLIFLSLGKEKIGLRALGDGLASPAALLGLACGLGFAISGTGFRAASLSLAPDLGFAQSAAQTLVVTLIYQTILMAAFLMWREPGQLTRVVQEWRPSLTPGAAGAAASAAWFTAMTLEPAAHVRMVGLVDVPISVAVSLLIFRERPTRVELISIGVLSASIVLLLYSATLV